MPFPDSGDLSWPSVADAADAPASTAETPPPFSGNLLTSTTSDDNSAMFTRWQHRLFLAQPLLSGVSNYQTSPTAITGNFSLRRIIYLPALQLSHTVSTWFGPIRYSTKDTPSFVYFTQDFIFVLAYHAQCLIDINDTGTHIFDETTTRVRRGVSYIKSKVWDT